MLSQGDRTNSPARSNDSRKHPIEFNGTNRLNKRLKDHRGVHLEDEWQSYWDQAEDSSNEIYEAEENFTNHLKVSQDKYLPKEDISLDDVVVTEKVTNLTTFAAQLKKVPCPVVPTLSLPQEITPPPVPEKEEKKVEGNLIFFSVIYCSDVY